MIPGINDNWTIVSNAAIYNDQFVLAIVHHNLVLYNNNYLPTMTSVCSIDDRQHFNIRTHFHCHQLCWRRQIQRQWRNIRLYITRHVSSVAASVEWHSDRRCRHDVTFIWPPSRLGVILHRFPIASVKTCVRRYDTHAHLDTLHTPHLRGNVSQHYMRESSHVRPSVGGRWPCRHCSVACRRCVRMWLIRPIRARQVLSQFGHWRSVPIAELVVGEQYLFFSLPYPGLFIGISSLPDPYPRKQYTRYSRWVRIRQNDYHTCPALLLCGTVRLWTFNGWGSSVHSLPAA